MLFYVLSKTGYSENFSKESYQPKRIIYKKKKKSTQFQSGSEFWSYETELCKMTSHLE